MAAIHQLETLGSGGRQVVRWDPADPRSVASARAEFEQLKASGWALFELVERPGASVETRTAAFEPAAGSFVARSPLPTQTDTFRPEATRIVAVRPMRGG